MDDHEFRVRACLEVEALEAWVAAGWLARSAGAAGQDFTEIDVARAHLIHDLRRDIGVNDEGIGVILDLIDKLHGMRRTLGNLLSAIQAQPDDVRQRLIVSAHEAIVVHHTSWASDKSASPRSKSAGSGEPGGG
jgi:chaperone modulatory protein CbpM